MDMAETVAELCHNSSETFFTVSELVIRSDHGLVQMQYNTKVIRVKIAKNNRCTEVGQCDFDTEMAYRMHGRNTYTAVGHARQ